MSIRVPVVLRPLEDRDVDILFANQNDPFAAAMAEFPSRDHDSFVAHVRRTEADPTVLHRVVVVDGHVVGDVASFPRDGHREVGYWIGRDYWGRGYATSALQAFLALERIRPLRAGVSPRNEASIRVLERCGFVAVGQDPADGFLLYDLAD